MLPAFPKPHRSAVKPKRLAALALARGAVSIGGILQSKAPPSAGAQLDGAREERTTILGTSEKLNVVDFRSSARSPTLSPACYRVARHP